jgi:hypothetical protein
MFTALRNGLAHRFRPNTISTGADHLQRFRFRWRGEHLRPQHGNPNWLNLELDSLCDRALAAIDGYEKELQADEAARRNFRRKHQEDCLQSVTDEPVAYAWKALGK